MLGPSARGAGGPANKKDERRVMTIDDPRLPGNPSGRASSDEKRAIGAPCPAERAMVEDLLRRYLSTMSVAEETS
ncbi:MAG: hypothetical protein AAF565_00860 [Pseudomonadota bacterium]